MESEKDFIYVYAEVEMTTFCNRVATLEFRKR